MADQVLLMTRQRVGHAHALPPFVGCFTVDNKCYVYDVNTNTILRVEPDLFALIVDGLKNPGHSSELLGHGDFEILRTSGFCSAHRPRFVQSPCTKCFARDIKTKLRQVTLEITQDCNQRCTYCPYSPLDTTRRSHSSRRIDWTTAQAGIDLLLANSKDSELPSLGFYGGEPLLEWALIQRSIEYARMHSNGRPLHLGITTNGTCVTEDSAQVLARNEVAVLVSLDGPAEAHDRFRRMRRSRASAYSKTIDGLRLLRSAYGLKGTRHIRINAVCGPWTDFQELQSFFQDPPAELEGLSYRVSIVSHPRIDLLTSATIERTASPPAYLGLSTLESDWNDSLARAEIDLKSYRFVRALFEDEVLRVHKRSMEPLCEHVGLMGMCIPGLKKVYIDVDGWMLPCERVSEQFRIGHVAQGGFDISSWESMLKPIVEFCQGRCTECIFCRLCSGCLVSFVDSNGRFSQRAMEQECARQKERVADLLIRYVRALARNAACFDYMNEIELS